jgi:hypothetical protein
LTLTSLNHRLPYWDVILVFETHGFCSTSHKITHLFQLYASVNIDWRSNASLLYTKPYFSQLHRASPPPILPIPHSLNHPVKISGGGLQIASSHVSHLWLQNVLGILRFPFHTCFRLEGSSGSLRRGTGLLITHSYRGLIVISSFLCYPSWMCSPSY